MDPTLNHLFLEVKPFIQPAFVTLAGTVLGYVLSVRANNNLRKALPHQYEVITQQPKEAEDEVWLKIVDAKDGEEKNVLNTLIDNRKAAKEQRNAARNIQQRLNLGYRNSNLDAVAGGAFSLLLDLAITNGPRIIEQILPR